MRTTAIYRTDYAPIPEVPFPNAATRKDILRKFLDLLLMGALGAGAAAILLFMLVLI